MVSFARFRGDRTPKTDSKSSPGARNHPARWVRSRSFLAPDVVIGFIDPGVATIEIARLVLWMLASKGCNLATLARIEEPAYLLPNCQRTTD